MRTAGDDAERLSALQAKWGRHWRIWRGRHGLLEDGDWIATRLDPNAGVSPTVIKDDADQLNEALHREANLVAQGRKPLTISEAGPE